MNLVHPQLIGKMIQKVEEDGGKVIVHTKAFILEIEQDCSESGVVSYLHPREGKPEPLVIPAKKA